VTSRALVQHSRSYSTKIKSAQYPGLSTEKSKENKTVNLLTEEQADLLTLSSPSKILLRILFPTIRKYFLINQQYQMAL